MKDKLFSAKSYLLLGITIILLGFSIKSNAQVIKRDTLLTWRHFDYILDENNGMQWFSTTNIVEEDYQGIVLENEFVRLVIIPEFGARVISFLYKPTGHEQFYTNPVGNPYGIGEGNFYYDWLMVFGGVFPTFPEPEHGKTWFLPWHWEFTEISDNRIVLQMQLKDTINFQGHPGKFNNGITEVLCISTVILEKGKTSFDFNHEIQNTKSSSVIFEYWTCTTLAPGSVPGNTFTPSNSEIIAPINYVYLKDDWWSWMGNAEDPAPQFGNHVFNYNNLANYSNWDDMGIAYAYPDLDEKYYGVVNHTNNEGIFRVSNNAETTPGMKFWTWGAQQGLNADPENFYHTARPYIELWSGLSTQFFEDASLGGFESVGFTETYLPTVTMGAFSTVNENGALYIGAVAEGDARFESKVFMNLPDTTFAFTMELKGDVDISIFDGEFIAESKSSSMFTVYLSDYSIPDGDYELIAEVSKQQNDVVLSYSVPVTIPIQPSSIPENNITMPKIIRVNSSSYKLLFSTTALRNIIIYSVNGQRIGQQKINGSETVIQVETPGIYVIQIYEGDFAYPVKVRF